MVSWREKKGKNVKCSKIGGKREKRKRQKEEEAPAI